MDRQILLNFAKNDEDRILISRIIDQFETTINKNIFKYSPFLNGHQVNIAKYVASQYNVKFDFYGGYNEAERKIFVTLPDYIDDAKDLLPLKFIKVELKGDKCLSHRDYTGAVLNLGIKREKIGDIVVYDKGAWIICMEDISGYIVSNVEKIGNCGVVLEVSSADSVEIPPRKFKEITCVCSSVRLDALISGGAGLSRNEAALLIESGMVKVNWETCVKNDFNPREGDILSVQGYGRFLLHQIGGTSKKGRRFVTLRKFV